MEPETNTLTPDVTEKKRSNAPLYIIFGFLLAAIIALVIVIVIVNVNNKKDPVATETTEEDAAAKEAAKNGTSTDVKALAEAGWTNPEELAQYNVYKADYEAMQAKAQEMIATEPSNVAEIYKMYQSAINASLQNNKETEAYEYFNGLVKLLKDNNMKEEAMNAYSTIDLSGFSGYSQFYLYTDAESLAKELGDEKKAARYNTEKNKNTAAWEESLERLEQYTEREKNKGM